MKLTYAQQLQHPNWQRRRLEMLQAAGWSCQACYNAEDTLHVHHKRYIKGRMAWEYADHELAVLCKTCHENEHYNEEQLRRLLACVPPGQSATFNALSLLAGFFSVDCEDVEALAADIGVYQRFATIGLIAATMRRLSTEHLGEVLTFIESLQSGKKQ